jgi:hypothetical protein
VSKIAIVRWFGLSAVLLLTLAILPAATGQAQHSHLSPAPDRLALAADTTVRQGFHANLPPHISTLLGISKEEESAVMQVVVRSGNLVQGIDVSVKNKNDIVLFVVDEAANNQSLYLTSPEGTLRRLVLVNAGVGSVVPVTDEERNAFQKEKQFWVDRLVSSGAAK